MLLQHYRSSNALECDDILRSIHWLKFRSGITVYGRTAYTEIRLAEDEHMANE